MGLPAQTQPAPYLAAVGGSTVDTVTAAGGGQGQVTVSLVLTGSIANLQTDWATLVGTTFASQAVIGFNGGN
jgi:hypothetical protein